MAVISSLLMAFSPLASVNAATQASVRMIDNIFSPYTITIEEGTTITWTNDGYMAHTVTADNGSFDSGSINSGGTYSHTFNTSGTIYYHCTFHGSAGGVGMAGIIIVQAATDGGTSGTTSTSLTASVTQASNPIVINGITTVKGSGAADGTFENGWKWIFDVTVPLDERYLSMKFSNWLMTNGGSSIPVANNMRFYSSQSNNATTANSAIYIRYPDTYSSSMYLTGNLDAFPQPNRRHIQITVEAKIPSGTPTGTYSTNFGIRTQ